MMHALLEICAHHIFNIRLDNELRIKIILSIQLCFSHASANFTSNARQQHFRHTTIALSTPNGRGFLLQQGRHDIFIDTGVKLKALGGGQIQKDASQLVASVIREFKRGGKALAELWLESQKRIYFQGESSQDDKWKGVILRCLGRINVANQFHNRIISCINAISFAGHTQSECFVNEQHTTACFIQHFSSLENRHVFFSRDQIHAFYFQKFGLSQ
mmetsp:Transcript_22860/g.49885  ORF Transcript_22860/g.49885 Transcript_22860/m.49885 type:complete len:216 (-) Transcript_22860:1219-1866(-)